MTLYAKRWLAVVSAVVVAAFLGIHPGAFGQQRTTRTTPAAAGAKLDQAVKENADRMLLEGLQTFRFDTFGSEEFWADKLKLHQAIQGQKSGGVGPGVSPKRAL